ncbi:AAA family ATPase [Paracoccus marinaquae]|uniref:AAA family ATPase n=1 Tax=Paracoccus marinaquae TaxID=2841926 RepID=A0ABS6AP78_9RHOB|nr:AAA family ATPase [Paracoccus marinaquae]MBU3032383.1 AAA family ATPase [Paracoccus marinaquae]
MAEVVQLAKPGATAPVTQGFVMTESAQDILRSLQLVRAAGDAITLIAAAPGTGKTEALRQFANGQGSEVVLVTAVAGEGTPWGVACQLMQLWNLGAPNSRNLMETRQMIGACVGRGGLLLVDEAQYLVQRNPRGKDTWDSLEWLRAMAEEGQFSLAFCGDLALLDTASRLPQLWLRMRRRVVIKYVSKVDVAALAGQRGFTDASITEVLYRVARRGGGLGDVDSAISHARLLSGENIPAPGFIMAALEDLKLLSREDRA